MNPVFLAVEPDPFVAGDLHGILTTCIAQAQVLVARELDEAGRMIAALDRLDYVFLSGSAANAEAPEFLSALSRLGATLVRIGATLPETAGGAVAELRITAPFTNDSICDVLRNLRNDGPSGAE